MEEMTINTATEYPGLETKTDLQRAKEERELAIYEDREKMLAIEGQSRTNVIAYLMQRYGIHSAGTIYCICARVQKRLDAEKKKDRGGRAHED